MNTVHTQITFAKKLAELLLAIWKGSLTKSETPAVNKTMTHADGCLLKCDAEKCGIRRLAYSSDRYIFTELYGVTRTNLNLQIDRLSLRSYHRRPCQITSVSVFCMTPYSHLPDYTLAQFPPSCKRPSNKTTKLYGVQPDSTAPL